MINFKHFIVEENTTSKTNKIKTDVHHVEDRVIHGGNEGVGIAAQHLDDMHDILLGKDSTSSVSHQYDGMPLVFGHHPETGKFFVSTDSGLNKNPKINYTEADIKKNHGNSSDAKRLKAGLDHLPKIMPRNGGVYRSDMLYSKQDLTNKKGNYVFKPRDIEYSIPKDTPHGKTIKNAQIGVSVHTQYNGGRELSKMDSFPISIEQKQKFQQHPDVHNIDNAINVNPSNYTPEEQRAFLTHKELAKQTYGKIKPEALETLDGYGPTLQNHIDDMIKNDGIPDTQSYIGHLTNINNRTIDKTKVKSNIDKKIQKHADDMKNITDNSQNIDKALELHGHLQRAKDVLLGVMHKNNDFSHNINGIPTSSKSAVITDKDGNSSKLENRGPYGYESLRSKRQIREDTVPVPNQGNAPSMAEISASGAPQESGPEKKKKKSLKENNSSAVGGLGFNTGTPSADEPAIANYVARSTADADTRDNVLKGMIKDYHDKFHAPIGFKSFNPVEFKKAK
jgi:hypothetical protein